MGCRREALHRAVSGIHSQLNAEKFSPKKQYLSLNKYYFGGPI